MKKLIIPIIAFIGMGANLSAQEKSQAESDGDKFIFRYSYTEAIDAYTHAKHLTVEGERRLANSYHEIGENELAEEAYLKLILTAQALMPEDY